MKVHIFIAYGELHDLLALKRLASLIEILKMHFMDSMHYLQILKMLYLSLYYLGNLRKIFMTRNSLEDFENIVAIWLLKYFMKLFGSELCILNTLTCELLTWFCHCAMILVITPSLWRSVYVTTHLCDDPVCVTTCLCDNLVMWPWVRFLDLKWYWIFYGSQWIICSFIITLGSLVLQYVYYSCHNVKGIYFAEFKWKFPNFSMFVKCSLSWNLHFPHLH